MIFIIIPVFNRKEFTRNCLQGLKKQTFKDYKAIVIDDGSTDGTSSMIQNEFPEVHVIKGDGNLWWAGATNAGVQYVFNNYKCCATDFILTLNNDLEVPANYLERLAYHASINDKVILGSVSIDIETPDRLEFCGIKWNQFTGKYFLKTKTYGYSYTELGKREKQVESDMLPGRGTLIPVKVFDEIGFYDSLNFPQYAADEDFSLRAKRNGWKLIIPTDVYVKSHVAETGTNTTKVQLSLKYFRQLFFSIKSPVNLKTRYRFSLKNTRLKILYFVIDLIRITASLAKGFISGKIKEFKSAK